MPEDNAHQYCCTVMQCRCVWCPLLAPAQRNMACWSLQPHRQMDRWLRWHRRRQTTSRPAACQSAAWGWITHSDTGENIQAAEQDIKQQQLLNFSHTNTGGPYARARSLTLIQYTRQKGKHIELSTTATSIWVRRAPVQKCRLCLFVIFCRDSTRSMSVLGR